MVLPMVYVHTTFIKRVCEWFGTIEGSRDAAFLFKTMICVIGRGF
jgi:hypothetical protein